MSRPARRTRAVILAAGRGTRLGSATADLPKVMVVLAGRTLLAHQRSTLRAARIDDIHLVLGHGAAAVRVDPDAQGLTIWENPAYATTNMVATLLCADGLLDGSADLVIAYGDIVYTSDVVAALLAVDAPVSVVVDLAWRDYWQARMADPLADAETLRMDADGRLTELGRRPDEYDDVQGQYTGMIRVRADATLRFRASATALVGEDPRAYMTTLLQRLIDDGVHVQAAPVHNGWLEIDQPADLEIDHARFWSSVD